MTDIIKGKVIKVIDGDTFDLQVSQVGKNNSYKYNDVERIRIASVDKAELNTLAGLIAKRSLTNDLLNKVVTCEIHGRDAYGRLVCKIKRG